MKTEYSIFKCNLFINHLESFMFHNRSFTSEWVTVQNEWYLFLGVFKRCSVLSPRSLGSSRKVKKWPYWIPLEFCEYFAFLSSVLMWSVLYCRTFLYFVILEYVLINPRINKYSNQISIWWSSNYGLTSPEQVNKVAAANFQWLLNNCPVVLHCVYIVVFSLSKCF